METVSIFLDLIFIVMNVFAVRQCC
jgi:hypothetical protein